jgi:hypothetical protein
MYYRVALKLDPSLPWQWKSTVLSSLNSVLQWLQVYRALPPDRLRVFSSSSRGELQSQLEQENTGLASHSVTAAQFLRERRLCPPAMPSTASREGAPSREGRSVVGSSQQTVNKRDRETSALENRGMSVLERRREELEGGPGGDHDLPYHFSLPHSLPQVLAWMRLLTKAEQGAFQS